MKDMYRFEDIENMQDNELDTCIDSLCEMLSQLKEQSAGSVYLANDIKIEQVKFSYVAAKKSVTGENIKVSYELHKPVHSMGSVSIDGQNIVVKDTKMFCRAAEFADNTEIYPLRDGRMRITFTFHGLVNKIN